MYFDPTCNSLGRCNGCGFGMVSNQLIVMIAHGYSASSHVAMVWYLQWGLARVSTLVLYIHSAMLLADLLYFLTMHFHKHKLKCRTGKCYFVHTYAQKTVQWCLEYTKVGTVWILSSESMEGGYPLTCMALHEHSWESCNSVHEVSLYTVLWLILRVFPSWNSTFLVLLR